MNRFAQTRVRCQEWVARVLVLAVVPLLFVFAGAIELSRRIAKLIDPG